MIQSARSMHKCHATCTRMGHGTRVALVHMAFLTLSFAGCDVQVPHPRAHGMTGTCNMLGTCIPPVWLTAASSSLLGKDSLALAPQQHCRAVAGTGSPGSTALPWHSTGPGWSLPASAKCAGRSQCSAGTKGALSADTVQTVRREGRGWGGVASFPTHLCPGSVPGAALPSPSRVHLPVHWAALGKFYLLLTLILQARYQLLLEAIPLPMLAVEGYGGAGFDKLGGLFQDSTAHCLPCSQSAVQCLTWTPVPSCVLSHPHSLPPAQKHMEPGAAPSHMETAGSPGELGDGTAMDLLSSHPSRLSGGCKMLHTSLAGHVCNFSDSPKHGPALP